MDYATMRGTIHRINERTRTLAGEACPNATCFGELYRRNGRLLCTGCARSQDGTPRSTTVTP